MRHAISSIFKAVSGARTQAAEAEQGVSSHARSSSMTALSFDQLRFVTGGDDATVDGLPKGGWKTSTTTA